MIDPAEHVYDDDPARGHADVRTRLAGVSYFFIGNGAIQAAVQWAPGGEGTPLGLLVMDPERFGRKRDALTQDPERGLAATSVAVTGPGRRTRTPREVHAAWGEHDGVPAVVATWTLDEGTRGAETFYCPDPASPVIVREVRVLGDGKGLRVRTGIRGDTIAAPLDAGGIASFVYELRRDSATVTLRAGRAEVSPAARAHWASRARLEFGHDALDRFGSACQAQLFASLSNGGRLDSSIWQYNREWVRDQSFVAIGFLMAGDPARAARILRRLLAEFVTPEGGTVDSSEARAGADAELDQNGQLLYALEQYVRWTGDLSIAESCWPRIAAAAEYPIGRDFMHPGSGLLCNCREFWERHEVHGVAPGFEIAHQLFVSTGLGAASCLARRLHRPAEAERWQHAAEVLRTATLSHPVHALVSGHCLVKRKNLDGTTQDAIVPRDGSLLPPGAPLAGAGPHLLNPDTSAVLPLVYGFLAPSDPVAQATLDSVEPLWNQAWTGGGYGRYHVSSEPDSPGGWPFASLFVARAAVEAGVPDRAWRVLRWLDSVAGAAAGSWFEFYGNRVSPPCPQVGIVPWTWAELLALLVEQVLGIRTEADGVRVRPHLLPGLDHATAHLPLGRGRLSLQIVRERHAAPSARLTVDGRPTRETRTADLIVPHGIIHRSDVDVEITLPAE
jgi:hypothetical protein